LKHAMRLLGQSSKRQRRNTFVSVETRYPAI
jgi:hypothetical protein